MAENNSRNRTKTKTSDNAITDEITVFALPCFNENQMSDNTIAKPLFSRCHVSRLFHAILREPFILAAVQTSRFQKSEATLGNSLKPMNEKSCRSCMQKPQVLHQTRNQAVELSSTKSCTYYPDTSRCYAPM